MDRTQANQTAMLRTVAAHMENHPEVLTAIPSLQELATELDAALGRIDQAALAKSGGTVGVTEDKEAARREATRFAVPIGAAATAHANKTGNATLRQKVDFSRSALDALREEEYLTTLDALVATVNSLAVDLAPRGITAQHLAGLTTAASTFRTLVAAPRRVRVELTEAVETLAQEIDAAMKLVREEMDPTAEGASLSFPAFSSGYRAARVIIDRPASHEADETTPALPTA